MFIRHFAARAALGALVLSCLAAPSFAYEGVLGLPAVGPMSPEQMTAGPLHIGFGAQAIPNRGTIGIFDFSGVFELGDLNTRLMANPTNPLGFFGADVNATFRGQTGMFLPINLMPFMGLGAAMYMYEPVAGQSGSFTAGIPFYVPIGLRYHLPLGPLSVGAEASYYYGLGDMLGEGVDLTRWHYEASARLGLLSAAVYTETGPLLSGSGAKIGLNF